MLASTQIGSRKLRTGRSWISRSRGWISIALLVPVILYTAFSRPHWPLDSWTTFGLDCVGWLLFLLGAAWRWWATLYIGGHKDSLLAQSGPYSMTRNPLYFGTLLLAMSAAFLTQSLAFGVGLTCVAYLYLRITIPNEENRLLAKFGLEYETYLTRVPRFWPRLGRVESPATLTVEVSGLRAELLRSLRWGWLPIICHLISHLRSQTWWPFIGG